MRYKKIKKGKNKMKKLCLVLIVLAIFIFPTIVTCEEWYPTNQITVVWTAAPMATSYKIYIKSADGGGETEVGSTDLTLYTVTLTKEGRYFLGVQSIRENVETIPYSDISWTDNPVVCLNSEPFGVVYYIAPDMPTDLRRQQ